MATDEGTWFGTDSQVSRTRGRLFEALCLGSTSVGIMAVMVLLLYVTNDALRPATADLAWHATFALTVLVPAGAFAAYYYRSDSRAGEVAYTTTGIPVVGVLVAGGLFVLFVEIVQIREYFALAIGVGAVAAALYGHATARPRAGAVERSVVTLLLPVVVLFGAPPVAVARLVGLSKRIVSLPELVLKLPYLPLPSLQLTATLALPVAAVVGVYLARRWESERDGLVAGALVVAGALAGLVLGPLLGIGADGWVILYTPVVVPLSVYVAETLRRGDGASGLLFPAVLVGGVLAGVAITQGLGLTGPETWLDWGFLTSADSIEAAAAGIYPSLVGSVMLLLIVVLATFPVGVGAAIYLEEYAPSGGLGGKVVTLIEINIANLAGVPSIVYGLLGLALFIRYFHFPTGSPLVGGLAVGLLILPIVIISAQEAIQAVPDSLRKASYGMGGTRWQTIRNVVLPEAMPGIMTGTIIALGRAIGETAPLLMIGMAASVRVPPGSFLDKASAMPRMIYAWSSQPDPQFRYGVLAAGVVTLLVVLLVMNATAILIRNKYQRQ